MANGGFCTVKTQLYFCKLEGKLSGMLFRLVWQEPHSAISWLRHCINAKTNVVTQLITHNKQIFNVSTVTVYTRLEVNVYAPVCEQIQPVHSDEWMSKGQEA